MKDCILWYSRHEATASQMADMSRAGHDGAPVVHLEEEASRPILSVSDARETLDMLAQSGACAIFGVFPPILQAGITADRATETLLDNNGGYSPHGMFERAIPVFGSWNVKRAQLGDTKPQAIEATAGSCATIALSECIPVLVFEHRLFVRVGSLLEVREGNEHYRL